MQKSLLQNLFNSKNVKKTNGTTKKRILLVSPLTPVSYWSFKYSLGFVGKKASLPPLGLITIAALIPDEYECTLIDINIKPLRDEEIINADLVMISAMLIQQESFLETAERCKAFNKTVIAGGSYPTSSYPQITCVDHFVLGEAENILSELFRDLEKGTAKKIYRSADKPDLSLTPVPRYDLLDLDSYYSMSVQYSRGCPFTCEFCDIVKLFGHKVRVKENEQFIAELDRLYELGWNKSVFIVDDNFIGNKKKAYSILRSIIRWQEEKKYPFSFYTEASINLADDPQLLALFGQAGVYMVFLGIETPSQEALADSGKMQNVGKDLISSVARIQSCGIEVSAGFIVGFDSDTEDIFDRQIEFINKSGITTAMVGLLQALPGTKLYNRLEQENRLLDDSSGNNTYDFILNFKPVLDKSALIDGYKKILKNIYSPENYFRRASVYLKRAGVREFGSLKLSVPVLAAALFKSLLKQTISSYGHRYLFFIIRSFFLSPRLFPTAVNLSIQYYHLSRITDQYLAVDNFKENLIKRLEHVEEISSGIGMEFSVAKAKRILLKVKNKEQKKILANYNKLHRDFKYLIHDALEVYYSNLNKIYPEQPSLLVNNPA